MAASRFPKTAPITMRAVSPKNCSIEVGAIGRIPGKKYSNSTRKIPA
jgi:hypothetical protein